MRAVASLDVGSMTYPAVLQGIEAKPQTDLREAKLNRIGSGVGRRPFVPQGKA
jgi:hypothetical protein